MYLDIQLEPTDLNRHTHLFDCFVDFLSKMLSSRNLLTLSLFLSVLQFTYGRHHKHEEGSQPAGHDFDLLVFSQTWPPTFCFEWKENAPSHRCSLPRQEEWTIHGLWPNRFDRKAGPYFCDKTQRFNGSALSPIIDILDEKWINIKDGTPHLSFWKQEWKKHGTCALAIEDTNTELKYFQKSLDLLDEHDMTRVLATANIVPGGNYAVQEIIDGVERSLGKTLQIKCIIKPETHESFISEIRICLDKSFKLINCNDNSGSSTNCDRRMQVNYPATTPPIRNKRRNDVTMS